MSCKSGFTFPFDSRTADFDDVFVRKEFFLEGGLWLWGFAGDGGLGNNSRIDQSSPVQTVSGGTNWKQVSLGSLSTAAIKSDGSLWLWGGGGSNVQCNGLLGNNSIANRSSPVQTVSGGTDWKQVSLGKEGHVAAIKTDGSLWLWGNGFDGALGTNSTICRSSPVQTISGGTNWKQVSAGAYFSAAIKTDASLWIWGEGNYGKLGNNSIVNQSTPIQTVSGGTNWKQVNLGAHHLAAIKTDGTLWVWGRNEYGQLGTNSIVCRSSPVQTISGGTNWKQVSLARFHSAAIKTDGTLWLWGRNHFGQLGNNSIATQSSPIQTVSGGTNWKQVGVSYCHSAAIKTDGTLWSFGAATGFGSLGNNSGINQSSPVQTISGGTSWRQLSLGGHTAAIREECW